VQEAVEQAHPDAASVHGMASGSTDILTAQVTSSSREEAAELADAYAAAFIEVRRQQEAGPYRQAADAVTAQLEDTTKSIAVLDGALGAAPPEQQAAVAASQTSERDALTSLQSSYSERLDEYQVAAVSATGGATVVEAARVEDSSSTPSAVKVGLIAGALGLIVGIGVIVFMDLADDRIRRGVDVESAGMWPLAAIPRVRPRRSRPGPEISAPTGDLRSGTVRTREAFRALRAVVESAHTHSGVSVVLVVGDRAGVGASTVAENLALALSEVGHSCAFVDLDPRTTESSLFKGGDVDLDRAGERFGARRRLFTYGGGAPDETALLSTERPGALIEQKFRMLGDSRPLAATEYEDALGLLSSHYEYVIVNSPPLSSSAEATAVGQATHAVIMVVAAGRTRRRDLRRMADAMHHVGASTMGAVVNFDDRGSWGSD
jgi:capsular polysaccharide biosynthesis protein